MNAFSSLLCASAPLREKIASRQAPPAAKAPFGDEAGESDEEYMPLVPERIGPAFGERDFAIGQAGDERVQAVERQHFAAGLAGEALQQRTIHRQRAEFFGLRLDGPAGVAVADFAAIGRRDT